MSIKRQMARILLSWVSLIFVIVTPATAQETDKGRQYYSDAVAAHQQGEATRAALYYALAAREGYAEAQFRLGEFHETGFGVDKDIEQARDWYGEAAGQGLEKAKVRLAALDNGKPLIEPSAPEKLDPPAPIARPLPEDSALVDGVGSVIRRDISSSFAEAKASLSLGNTADALGPLSYAAQHGHAEAQFRLAGILSSIEGPLRDESKSRDWLLRAVDQGYVPAIRQLGRTHLDPSDPQADLRLGVALIRRAAEAGDGEAQEVLAILHFTGFGVERSAPWAFRWATRAIDSGRVSTHRVAGLFHLSSRTEADRRLRAQDRFRQGAEAGDAAAQNAYGVMLIEDLLATQTVDARRLSTLESSEGVRDSINWLRRSADQGNLDAMRNLAHLYFDGGPQLRDRELAFDWYRRSASAGDAMAQRRFGIMHELGIATERNDTVALRWYLLAAGQGDVQALTRAAWVMATRYDRGLRDPSLALAYARRAIQSEDTADRRMALAAAHAALGSFVLAQKQQAYAIALAHRSGRQTVDMREIQGLFNAREDIACKRSDCLNFSVPEERLTFPRHLPL